MALLMIHVHHGWRRGLGKDSALAAPELFICIAGDVLPRRIGCSFSPMVENAGLMEKYLKE